MYRFWFLFFEVEIYTILVDLKRCVHTVGKRERRIKPRPKEVGEYRVGDFNSDSFGYEKKPRPGEAGDFFPTVKN
jgi:hypothetical protein